MQRAVVVQEQSAAVATVPQSPLERDVRELKRRKELINEVMLSLMKEGTHYGKIPGTDSMAMLKPGAEMLGMTFRLAPHFRVDTRELDRGHREYSVECTLTAPDGTIEAIGLGLCSTMESKYRYRYAQRKCPGCQRETIKKSKNGPGFYCWGKLGGCGQVFKGNDERITRQVLGKVENPDIADQMNTVMKMAVKRSHVAAILFATGASDMFVHEEEVPPPEERDGDDEPEVPETQAAPAKPTPAQELAFECSQLATKLGRDKDSLAELLKERGGWPPKNKWTDLTLGELKKAREILAAEVALIGCDQ